MLVVEFSFISGLMFGIEFFNFPDIGPGLILDLGIIRIRFLMEAQ